jgi:6-phosphogluconolactonase
MAIDVLCPGASLETKLSEAAAVVFEVLKQQPQSTPLVVALCGGRSVVGLLQALLRESTSQPAELLGRIQFFMVDERIVPLTDPDSNFGGLAQQFFNALLESSTIVGEQLHPLSITAEDSALACREYARELERYGGAFTVVILGMGEDGHVAGLFPHHPALAVTGRTFVPFFDSPKPPAARVTASRELVTGASLGVLLALGEGKRAAWEAFTSRASSLDECPAKMVESMKRCVVVTDLA